MKRYAGIVVFYNPGAEVQTNIESYINSLEKLYIMDNSDFPDKTLINDILDNKKIVYKSMNGNKGLAAALKVGCETAIQDGFDYVLTMDQDSVFANDSVENIISFIESSNNQYAVVASNAISVYQDELTKERKEAYTELDSDNKECYWAMTSGSMMNLKDYQLTKGFDEDLFIAHIDIDIGIQFHLLGKKIIKLRDAKLYQTFGNSKPKKLLWKTVHPSFAHPNRTYYIFRNQKYLERKYPKSKKLIGVKLYKFLIKIICFESNKLDKIKMAYRGVKDARDLKMGECSY